MITFKDKQYNSSAELFFDMFNDRLKLTIVYYLRHNPLRFKELMEYLAPITKRTLSLKLKELEELDLIERKAYPEVPPRVEYSLSTYGQKLQPVLDEILAFSQEYVKTYGEVS